MLLRAEWNTLLQPPREKTPHILKIIMSPHKIRCNYDDWKVKIFHLLKHHTQLEFVSGTSRQQYPGLFSITSKKQYHICNGQFRPKTCNKMKTATACKQPDCDVLKACQLKPMQSDENVSFNSNNSFLRLALQAFCIMISAKFEG